jgi:hypothetical protein
MRVQGQYQITLSLLYCISMGCPKIHLSVPFIELVVDGLCIGGEVKPRCMEIRHVLMIRRSTKDGNVDDVLFVFVVHTQM